MIRVVLCAMSIFEFIYFKLQPPEFVMIVKKTLLVNFIQIPTTFFPQSDNIYPSPLINQVATPAATVLQLRLNFKVDEGGVNVVRLRKEFTRRVFLTIRMNLGGWSLDFPTFNFKDHPMLHIYFILQG